MTKDKMVCLNCCTYNHETGQCHDYPIPFSLMEAGLDPATHFCAAGDWWEWNEYRERWVNILWGAWERQPPGPSEILSRQYSL